MIPNSSFNHAEHQELDKDPQLDLVLRSRLEKMRVFLWNYTKPIGACRWQAASLMTANAYEKSTWLASRLRQWTRAYILDRNDLPLNIYGTWNSYILEDEDVKENYSSIFRELESMSSR